MATLPAKTNTNVIDQFISNFMDVYVEKIGIIQKKNIKKMKG